MRKDNIEIYGVLQGLRNNCDYINVVNFIYKATAKQVEDSFRLRKLSLEESKSFLICLVLDSLNRNERSDILLCAWGLLKGYEYGKSLTQRRKLYLEQREEYVPSYIKDQPFKTFEKDIQKRKADDLVKKGEQTLY